MVYFARFIAPKAITKEIKSRVPIGIFGSFNPKNSEYLKIMKSSLEREGYFPLISSDIEELCPKPGEMSQDEYNHKISEILVRITRIHLVFLFRELNGEHGINLSAGMELQMMDNLRKRHVRIYLEKGCLSQLKSLLRGLCDKKIGPWSSHFFSRRRSSDTKHQIEESDFIFDSGIAFCFNRLKVDPETEYASREAFLKSLKIWCNRIMRT